MALISGIKMMERRPCWVDRRKGMFHNWLERDGVSYALIEFEDGHVEQIPYTTVTFLDHSDFEGYDWRDMHEPPPCDTCKHYNGFPVEPPCKECAWDIKRPSYTRK